MIRIRQNYRDYPPTAINMLQCYIIRTPPYLIVIYLQFVHRMRNQNQS